MADTPATPPPEPEPHELPEPQTEAEQAARDLAIMRPAMIDGRKEYATRRRKAERDVAQFCRNMIEDIRVRRRYLKGMIDGTLHPAIEIRIWDSGFGRPDLKSEGLRQLQRVLEGGGGLINILLRHPLTEDPLVPKPVEGTVIEAKPLAEPAPRVSIVPPARPKRKRTAGTGPPLAPGEEAMQ